MLTHFLAAPLGSLAIGILLAAATIQMYWALGGEIGVGLTRPVSARGAIVRPTMTVSLLAAISMVLAADLLLVRVGVFSTRISPVGVRIACGALALGFLVRSIGDFRQIGFFKRIRKSKFARLDTAVYSPVSLYLAVAIAANTL